MGIKVVVINGADLPPKAKEKLSTIVGMLKDKLSEESGQEITGDEENIFEDIKPSKFHLDWDGDNFTADLKGSDKSFAIMLLQATQENPFLLDVMRQTVNFVDYRMSCDCSSCVAFRTKFNENEAKQKHGRSNK